MLNVDVSVKTKQVDKLGNKDYIEMVSFGSLYEKKDHMYVIYKEELGNKEEVTTTIKIFEDEVSIKRFGNLNSNMVFNCNKPYVSRYHTAQGIFEIQINTNKLDITKNKNDLDINIGY
ncbi:MAG: DUF1934 domain-containing protein, partial [Paraclostridium sp.]